MPLEDSGILISLKLRQWSARKLDKPISKEICEAKKADQGSGSFNKQIIPKKYLTSINQLVNEIRNYHYENTLPWNHKGADLLPSRNYFKYTTAMGDFQDKFDKEVNEFITHYDTVIQQVHNNLNELYKKQDYPSVKDLRAKFHMEINATPIPKAGDFRIDINKKELTKLQENLQEKLLEAEQAAETELFNRLYTTLAKAVITLNDPNKIFRNTLIFNIETICRQIPNMNIKNNEKLNELAKTILAFCEPIDIDSLRTDLGNRTSCFRSLSNYLNDVEQLHATVNTSTKDNSGD